MSLPIYNYDKITKQFIGMSFADNNPLVPGTYLIPANATVDQPPITDNKHIAVYTNNTWVITKLPFDWFFNSRLALAKSIVNVIRWVFQV